jgi:tryptophan 7-halogenase
MTGVTMEGQKIRKVVIAGGGTAGWIAAFALVRQLKQLVDITLVESEEIGTVGVGESTIPTSRTFHQFMGVDEAEFVRATGSTFKLGISFENWREEGQRYFHPFGKLGHSTWMVDFHHFWLRAQELGFGGELGEYCLEQEAAEAQRFESSPQLGTNYAYHLDAGLYGKYLRRMAEADGVTRVEGKIAEIRQNSESGNIDSLLLDSGHEIEGDLFFDCTGFRGLLIGQKLGVPFEDWTRWLPTDGAIAVQTSEVEPPRPYTRAMAHKAGWTWRIPLQHRVGNGIVFSSAHMTPDEAERLLRERIEGDILIEPRLIRFRSGCRRKVWVKNCIALGLSTGFIEPLESTSIHLIMIAVTRALQMFPFAGISEAAADRFNFLAERELEGIRDFIVLHYHVTERNDSDFWRHCREMEIPDSLGHRLALFRDTAHAFQESHDLFTLDSWVKVMLGQGLTPANYHAAVRQMPEDRLRQSLSAAHSNVARAVERMPSHQEWLQRYARQSEPATRVSVA